MRAALALSTTFALGQITVLSGIESSTLYLSTIIAAIFCPVRPRAAYLELTLMSMVLIGLSTCLSMLAFLCSHSTRDPALDALVYAKIAAAVQSGASPQEVASLSVRTCIYTLMRAYAAYHVHTHTRTRVSD